MVTKALMLVDGKVVDNNSLVTITKKLLIKADVYSEINYEDKTVAELKKIAKDKNINGYYNMNKAELIKTLSK